MAFRKAGALGGGEAGSTTFSAENDGWVGTIKKASGGGGHRRRPITPFNPPLRSIRDQNSIKGLCLPLKEEGIVETRIESGMLKGVVFSHDKTGEKPTSLF